MTAAVDLLLGTKDGVGRSSINSLGLDDVADLAARAANPMSEDWPRALTALALFALKNEEVSATITPLVDQILSAGGLSARQRATIVALAGPAHANALNFLLAATEDADSDVAFTAWQSLQMVARSSDLAQLQEAAPPAGDTVGNLAQFTMSVIAYRAGHTGRELPTFDDSYIVGVPGDEAELYSISQSATTEEDFALISALSNAERYLVRATIQTTTTIKCGDQKLLVCLDPETLEASPNTLVQAPAMPAVIATVSPMGASAAVKYLVLTHPDGEGGFWLGAYLRNGTKIYQGHARAENITEMLASFSLWAMERPGVRPIALVIEAGATGIQLQSDQVTTMHPLREPLEPTPT